MIATLSDVKPISVYSIYDAMFAIYAAGPEARPVMFQGSGSPGLLVECLDIIFKYTDAVLALDSY